VLETEETELVQLGLEVEERLDSELVQLTELGLDALDSEE
jgi:hypothetical protein